MDTNRKLYSNGLDIEISFKVRRMDLDLLNHQDLEEISKQMQSIQREYLQMVEDRMNKLEQDPKKQSQILNDNGDKQVKSKIKAQDANEAVKQVPNLQTQMQTEYSKQRLQPNYQQRSRLLQKNLAIKQQQRPKSQIQQQNLEGSPQHQFAQFFNSKVQGYMEQRKQHAQHIEALLKQHATEMNDQYIVDFREMSQQIQHIGAQQMRNIPQGKPK